MLVDNYLSLNNRRMDENLFSSFVVQREIEKMNKIKLKKIYQIFKAIATEAVLRYTKNARYRH